MYSWGTGEVRQLGRPIGVGIHIPQKIPTLSNIVEIACGDQYSLALTEKGELYTWGHGSNGELGHGAKTHLDVPTHVQSLTNVVAMAAGGSHTVAVTHDGHVYTWGQGREGALGLGTGLDFALFPQKVESLTKIISVACGAFHCVALSEDGHIYAWGSNTYGTLGNGETQCSYEPIIVPELNHVVEVCAGWSHSMAILEDGSVWSWGKGDAGLLGLESKVISTTPKKIDALAGLNCHWPTNLRAGSARLLANWSTIRLLWIASRSKSSPLSEIPHELLLEIQSRILFC